MVDFYGAWDRKLSDDEIKSLSQDPWQMFHPPGYHETWWHRYIGRWFQSWWNRWLRWWRRMNPGPVTNVRVEMT